MRALELFTDDSQPHIRPRTWVQDGQLVSTDSEAAADPRKEPLEHYPELMRCVTTQGDSAWRTRALVGTRCGCRCGCTKSQHLPGDHAVAPFSAHKLDVVKGCSSSTRTTRACWTIPSAMR